MALFRSLLIVSLASSLAAFQPKSGYRAQVFAGGGVPDGTPALAATFGPFVTLATGPAGEVYVSSGDIAAVFRLDSAGILTLVAGTGVEGFSGDDGPAVNAELSLFSTLAVGPDGALYIADYGNGRIRKVSGGIISTVAGGGSDAGEGVSAANAFLYYPTGLAVDSSGNVYFAEQFSNRVREVSNGIVTTIAGTGMTGSGGDDGPAVDAELNGPSSVAVDSSGNIYIADAYNDRIRKISGGVIGTVAGTGSRGYAGDNGPAKLALLNLSVGCTLSTDASGSLYFTDWLSVRKVSGGVITTVAGAGPGADLGFAASAPALQFALTLPEGVATSPDGNFYFTDGGFRGIVVRVAKGQATIVAGGGSGAEDGVPAVGARLLAPYSIAMDRTGALYISDAAAARVRVVRAGTLNDLAGSGVGPFYGEHAAPAPALDAALQQPGAIAADASGNVYFTDGGTGGYIRKVSQGTITTIAENAPGLNADTGAARIPYNGSIGGLAVSSTGDVYFTEPGYHRVLKLSGGVVTTVAGTGSPGYTGDNGPAVNAQLNLPIGLAMDSAGNLYIADNYNGAIRKISNGIITTIAGPLWNPEQLAVDDLGDIYVSDGLSVYEASGGAIAQIPGGSSEDPATQIARPAGLAVDKAGCLYVTDTTNNRVLVFSDLPVPRHDGSARPFEALSGAATCRLYPSPSLPR